MQTSHDASSRYERVVLFTDYARIACQFPLYSYPRVKDVLDYTERRAYEVRDPKLEFLAPHLGSLPELQPAVTVLRHSICCVVPLGAPQPDAQSARAHAFEQRRVQPDRDWVYVPKRRQRAFVTCGPYVIQGDLHFVAETSALDALQSATAEFVAVTDATLRWVCADGPQEMSCTIVLLNRERVGFVAMQSGAP